MSKPMTNYNERLEKESPQQSLRLGTPEHERCGGYAGEVGMRIFSTFTGIGGFEVGIQNAIKSYRAAQQASADSGYSANNTSDPLQERGQLATCIGYSEIDKYAIKVYEKQFKTDKTTEEIKDDLDSIKTILSDENYGILEVCYVNTAESGQTSIKTTNRSVKNALKSSNLNGDNKIRQLINNTKEGLELCSDNECLICTEMSVSAVQSQSQSFSHLNTEMAMDTSTEKNMELAICINSPSKFTTQKNTKSYATTVITQRGDTAYAHINRKKPIRNFGDITKINAKELPDFDCLVGGFPCQAFSIAGKRKGFEDTRGTLFFDLARILQSKQPRLFVFENVKGLLSHDSGRTFRTIIATLTELGYDCQWQVLNSKDFGVPQNRERVYIVGHLRGTPRPEIFPLAGADGEDIIVSGVLDTETWRKRHEQIRRVHSAKGISPTIPTAQGGGVMIKIDTPSIRRLTPLECERLQGFPDNWTKYGTDGEISDTQRYKMCGNAVTTNVVQVVFERILS